MSNLRLKDHTWDAANVYDSSIGKTQEQINAELAGKQDTLVSGVNIKTINGASILEAGNLEIQGGGGSVTVDNELSDTSVNPVQNKVITGAVKQGLNHIVRIATIWEQGTINGDTGNDGDSASSLAKRCRTPDSRRMIFPDCIGGEILVNGPTGIEIVIRDYYNGSYIGSGGTSDWHAFPVTFIINPSHEYRFVIRKEDDGSIERNVDFTINDITFEYYTAEDSQSIIARNDPLEMEDKLQQLTRKTRTGFSSYGKKPLCFVHFSDTHSDAHCLRNVIDFCGAYKPYIDAVIHTGDTVRTDASTSVVFWSSTTGSEKILNVIGNHDTKVNDDWTGLSMSDSYDRYFAPYISNWDATYESGKTYYYRDFPTEGVRFVILDIMHQTQDQLTWFTSTLASALSSDLHVICFAHSRASWKFDSFDSAWDDNPNVSDYPSSFADSSAYTGTDYPSNLGEDYVDAVDDFIEGGGSFICWMHGHTHYKMLATIAGHPNQLDVAVGNAGGENYAKTYVCARGEYTKTMDNFNVVAVDATAKLLRICKVGVSYDRLMRKCDTFCWDYGNSKLLYPHDKYGIVITEQPQDISGAANSSATLKVTAIGDGLSYQWQFKQPSADAFSNASSEGATNAQWDFNITEWSNGRKYRCLITNVHGQKAVSNEVLCTITT